MRGKHDRTLAEPRLSHDTYAGKHWELIEEKCLGKPCAPGDCPNNGQCGGPLRKNDLFRCHEESFETTKFLEREGRWKCSMLCSQTHMFWKDLMRRFVTYGADDKAVFNFGRARDLRGVHACSIHNSAQHVEVVYELGAQGANAAVEDATMKDWDKAARKAEKEEKATNTSEAV
eukprot:6183481-Pleurochrysis_carterae.AAC.5